MPALSNSFLGFLPRLPALKPENAAGPGPVSTRRSHCFVEDVPTIGEWLQEQVPSRAAVAHYLKSFLPFLSWAGHYNLQWLAGDVVAGITIGALVVPQGMAYASLAKLAPQYGLYSSFVGGIVYSFFGTSKDISIGPVAVLSTVVGSVVDDVHSTPRGRDVPAHIIASSLSLITGLVVLAIGILRCGWIVDLISITCLSAFMTGSAITIAVSQLPGLVGLTGFSSRDSPYRVVINTLTNLPASKLDAAIGITALAALYLIRFTLTRATNRFPNQRRMIFFANTMRTVTIIVIYTIISWLVNRKRSTNPAFRVLEIVPNGFRHSGTPTLQSVVVSHFGSRLPATVIVMLVEHIAISKSFGRVNNYSIDPSQEMVAIGVTNVLGPFFGAFPSTGSFSRTAVNSKAGVRTPAAGLVCAAVVLLATYLLTAVFFYIPRAALSAVVIHAVGDLITPPKAIHNFWKVSPLEVVVFFVGVLISVFAHIEEGLYATVAISAAILIYRILKARGRFLGKARVHSILGDHALCESSKVMVGEDDRLQRRESFAAREVFLPLDHGDGSNPEVELRSPYPGVFIYRFSEGFNYPNASFALDYLTDVIFSQTRRTSPEEFVRPGDRPWNHAGLGARQRSDGGEDDDDDRPTLEAIILDFSSVNHVDITSVQRLIDVRAQLDLYTWPEAADWHIACINNRWTKRALVSAGFGVAQKVGEERGHKWQSIFSVAEVEVQGDDLPPIEGVGKGLKGALPLPLPQHEEPGKADLESGQGNGERKTAWAQMGAEAEANAAVADLTGRRWRRGAVIHGLDRPMFHVDLTSALQSAIANVEAKREHRASVGGSPCGDGRPLGDQ